MGSPPGVDYLDKDFDAYLGQSKQRYEENEESSIFAFLYKRFEKSGTRDWPDRTVEWFLIYILTEFATAPHNIRQGRAHTRLTIAYKQVTEQLVRCYSCKLPWGIYSVYVFYSLPSRNFVATIASEDRSRSALFATFLRVRMS